MLLSFSFYSPEPTFGSAKNPDFGADLDLSLIKLPPPFKKASVVHDKFEIIF